MAFKKRENVDEKQVGKQKFNNEKKVLKKKKGWQIEVKQWKRILKKKKLANNGKKVFKKLKNPLPSSPPPYTCQMKEKKKH